MRENVRIISNYHWRCFISGYDLPDKVKEEFDYVSNINNEFFMKYCGEYYWLGDFMRIEGGGTDNIFKDWDCMMSSTAFSGVLVRLHSSFHMYMIGRFVPCSSKSDPEILVDMQKKYIKEEGIDNGKGNS